MPGTQASGTQASGRYGLPSDTGEFSRIVEEHLTEAPPSRPAGEYAMLVASFFLSLFAE